MTQPDHPFTDLPEGASVMEFMPACDWHKGKWHVFFSNKDYFLAVEIVGSGWTAGLLCRDKLKITAHAPTPNDAFQALRAAVREMAVDLGVV